MGNTISSVDSEKKLRQDVRKEPESVSDDIKGAFSVIDAAGDANTSSTNSDDQPAAPEPPPELPDTEPMLLEKYHQRVKDILPENFSGIRLQVSKPLSNSFQTSHTFHFRKKESCYRFGAAYVGQTKVGPNADVTPIVHVEATPSGSLSSSIIHQFSECVRMKLISHMTPKRTLGLQTMLEHSTKRWANSLTLANPSHDLSKFILVSENSCQLSQNLGLSNQMMVQKSPMIPGGVAGVWQLGVRLNSSDRVALQKGPNSAGAFPQRLVDQSKWQVAVAFSPLDLTNQISFGMRLTDNLQLGTELDISTRQQEAITKFGYRYDLVGANTTFKSAIDSQTSITSTVEKRLTPFPFLLTFSVIGHPVAGEYILGVGLSTE